MRSWLLALSMLLTACQTPVLTEPGDGVQDAKIKLAQLAVADLTAAIKDARAHDDVIAYQCWEALLPIAERAQEAPAVVGAATKLQRLRDIRRTVEDDKLAAACSGLIMDTEATILRLVRLLGLG